MPAPLRDWLGDFRGGTLLILDEAHHAAPASGQKYAIDSQITRAVRDLAPRFEHRLFLSATPHNGHSNSFSALLEILDPQRFCRGVPVKKQMLDDVMVRRLKDDIREIQGGFPKRDVVQLDIDGLPPTAPELKLSALLDQYRQLREQRLKSRNQAQTGRRRAAYHRAATAAAVVGRGVRPNPARPPPHRPAPMGTKAMRPRNRRAAPPRQIDLLAGTIGSDDDRAALRSEELQFEEDAQIAAVSAATVGPLTDAAAKASFAKEQKLLDEMTEVAEAARGLPDARVRA